MGKDETEAAPLLPPARQASVQAKEEDGDAGKEQGSGTATGARGYCDVPENPIAIHQVQDVLKQSKLARVKKIVGAVRFVFEDLIQGILQIWFLAYRWDQLNVFQRGQVIFSVTAGIMVSSAGPFLEQRKLSKSTSQLEGHASWQAAGGPICDTLVEILETR